jgi:uncharacterized protein YwgA
MFDELNISSDWSTCENRRLVQKTVYLLQEAGIKMGYCFSWYLLGPYCPELTHHCLNLNFYLANDTKLYQKYELHADITTILDAIKPLLNVPEKVSLPQEDWLELVTSQLFIMKNKRYVSGETTFKMQPNRSYLLSYKDIAIEKINEFIFHGNNPYLSNTLSDAINHYQKTSCDDSKAIINM